VNEVESKQNYEEVVFKVGVQSEENKKRSEEQRK
jgi:hypothetical protein